LKADVRERLCIILKEIGFSAKDVDKFRNVVEEEVEFT
jgi:hypothetical protein